MAPGFGVWFSHSSQAPSSLARTLERHRWTLKVGVGRALRGASRCPGVVEAREGTDKMPSATPTRLERALVGDAGCLARSCDVGSSSSSRRGNHRFQSWLGRVGMLRSVSRSTSAELRTAPVRRTSWPAGWRPICAPTRSRIAWQGYRHHTQAHCCGPARRGTARPAANSQICCGSRRTASLDIAAPTASQATLSSTPNCINIEQGG